MAYGVMPGYVDGASASKIADASSAQNGMLCALLEPLARKHVSDEVAQLQRYLEGRQCGTLKALVEMDTVQWARAQRCTGMTPQLLAATISEVDRWHEANRGQGGDCFVPVGDRGTALSSLGSLFFELVRSLLALGSWILLCCLDLSTVWWSDTSSDERLVSNVISLVVLAAATLAFSVVVGLQCCCNDLNSRSIRPLPAASESKGQSTFRYQPTRVAVAAAVLDVLLLTGSLVWLCVHAAAQRSTQACVGAATFYSLLCLALVRSEVFKSPITERRVSPCVTPCSPGDSVPVVFESTPEPGEAGKTIALTETATESREEAAAPVAFLSEASTVPTAGSNRWKPLFEDPTFDGRFAPITLDMNAGLPKSAECIDGFVNHSSDAGNSEFV